MGVLGKERGFTERALFLAGVVLLVAGVAELLSPPGESPRLSPAKGAGEASSSSRAGSRSEEAGPVTVRAASRGEAARDEVPVPRGTGGPPPPSKKKLLIEGRVLLDPGVPRCGVGILLSADGYRWTRKFPGEDGRFRFQGLKEMPYDARIRLEGRPGKGDVSIPCIRPWREGEVGDPRLGRIDLRGRIHLFRLDPVFPGGRPARAFLLAWGDYLDVPDLCERRKGRPVTLLAWKDSVAVLVCARGSKVWRGEVREGVNRIVLEPGLPVKLILPRGFPVLPLRARLGCFLEYMGKESWVSQVLKDDYFRPPEKGGLIFRPEGDLAIRLPLPGEYKVGWMLWYRRKSGWEGMGTGRGSARIRVSRVHGPQVFLSGPDPQAVLDDLDKERRR